MSNLISIVVPAYNEEAGIQFFYSSLKKALPNKYRYELIFVNDGSRDNTLHVLTKIANGTSDVTVISLSRNFGKEAATTAGIQMSTGDATLILDADGQHPVELISDFLSKWESGAQVVIGVRSTNQKEGFVKKYGSKLFYVLFNKMTDERIIPGSTDFRLIDREVRNEFNKLSEKGRITRALIDWLGYNRDYIYFSAKAREHGEASYDTRKLVALAMNSFVSLTTLPLYISGYLGMIIASLSGIVGLAVIIEQFILGDPMSLNITGSASLGLLIIFLVGIILTCQGLVALYISRVYEEVKARPVYIINFSTSTIKKNVQ